MYILFFSDKDSIYQETIFYKLFLCFTSVTVPSQEQQLMFTDKEA